MVELNKKFLILICAVLTGCASQEVKNVPISVNKIESLPFGTSESSVVRVLGKPDVVRSGETALWVYDNLDEQTQRAALNFDSSGKLIAKAILPSDNEPEFHVDFVLKSKFSKIRFQSIDFPRCGKDYVSNDAMYVDYGSGISIRYSKSRRETEDISWSSPEQLKKSIDRILNCQK